MLRIRTIVMIFACGMAVALAQNGPAVPPPGAHVRVSTGVMLGLVQHKTMPVYPDEAMKKRIHGDVIFKIEVDETGKLTSSELLAGDPLLVDASNEALKTFRFRPYLLNETPVKFESQLGFHFAVEKTADGANGHVECMTTIPNRP